MVRVSKFIKFDDIELKKLYVGKSNFRTENVNEGIEELMDHIYVNDLLETIVVYAVDDLKEDNDMLESRKDKQGKGLFEILAGQRRFAAFKKLDKKYPGEGFEKIPCHIRRPPDDELDAKAISIGENLTQLPVTLADAIDACDTLFKKYGDEREIQLTDLTDREREIWEEDFSKQLKLRWTHDGKSFVKATGYTGILALPRYNISIIPRIPNANYNAMLTYALQLGKVLKDPIPIEKDYDFWKYLVLVFSKRLEILGRNFYHSYIEVEENLNLVRGKIDFTQHLLHNFNRPDKIYCRFTEFTMNVLENQLIKTTLHKLIYGFQLVPFSVDIKKPLRRFYDELGFVDLILTNPKLSFNSIIYTRLNNHYKEILQICELILREQSSELAKRDSKSGFELIVDTDELFQDFINGMLNQRNRKERLGLKISTDKTGVPYDRPEKRHHFPDFRIKKGQNEIILDTKYYPQYLCLKI